MVADFRLKNDGKPSSQVPLHAIYLDLTRFLKERGTSIGAIAPLAAPRGSSSSPLGPVTPSGVPRRTPDNPQRAPLQLKMTSLKQHQGCKTKSGTQATLTAFRIFAET